MNAEISDCRECVSNVAEPLKNISRLKRGALGKWLWLCLPLLLSLLCAKAETPPPAPYLRPSSLANPAPKQATTLQELTQPFSPGPSARTLGSWLALGPAPTTQGQVDIPPNEPVCGAIQTVAAHPVDPNILYIGAVNGGIWRTTNATASNPNWIPLTDTLPSLSIGALEFDPTDSTRQTLIGGSGRVSSFGADGGARIGVLRSTDGGNTWAILGANILANENLTSVSARST